MKSHNSWWHHKHRLILFDTSFWLGLVKNESKDFKAFVDCYSDCTFLIPYPSFAEFLNDFPLKNIITFNLLKSIFIDSATKFKYYKYCLTESERDSFLRYYFTLEPKSRKHHKSAPNFVDIIIGKIIEEETAPFVFATKTQGDFARFFRNSRGLQLVINFGNSVIETYR